MIRRIENKDIAAVTAIYNHYILHSIATFEEQAISNQAMEERVDAVLFHFPWLVYEADGVVLGYAYANTWKTRSAYNRTVETSVYLAPGAEGRGIGKALYTQLIDALHAAEMHVLIGGISLPNEASVGLHESLGFVKIGHFKEVGYKFGQWIDVGYWELLL